MADNGKIIRNGAEIQIDENGNVVARPAAGQELIVEDDAVVGSLEAGSVSTESLVRNDVLIDLDTSFGPAAGFIAEEGPDDVSSTDFVTVDRLIGTTSLRIPDGATLFGNFFSRISDLTDGETAEVRPVIVELEQGSSNREPLDELTLHLDGNDNLNREAVGFTEITSTPTTSSKEFISGVLLEAKVSGGTLSFRKDLPEEHIMVLEWRVD